MYRCLNCPKTFSVLTQDGFCDSPGCFGEILVPYAPPGGGAIKSTARFDDVPEAQGSIEGLCVLVCDISGSMSTPAFPEHPAEKLRLVTNAISRAIAELETISRPDNAYIAIVAFGAKAAIIRDSNGEPFVKSVAQIIAEFGEGAVRLPTYLYDYFTNDLAGVDRGATDLNAALKIAREIHDLTTIKKDLSSIGVKAMAKLMDHSAVVDHATNKQISMANIRVMIYSDGAHNGGTLKNAFDGLYPSPLMTAFIGNDQASTESRLGADQMKLLANDCPEHGQKGYFLINSPDRYAVLRKLFRMASGASGFCPQCLKSDARLSE